MNGTNPYARRNRSFTLLEVTVVLAIFSLVVVAASRAFITVQESWRRQQHIASLLDNGRWFLSRVTTDIRHARETGISVESDHRRLILLIDTNGDGSHSPGERIWYWRGDDGGAPGNDHTVYCDQAQNPAGLSADQKVAEYVAHTDEEGDPYDMFSEDNGLVTVNVVLRQFPDQDDDVKNRSYALVTKVRARNP